MHCVQCVMFCYIPGGNYLPVFCGATASGSQPSLNAASECGLGLELIKGRLCHTAGSSQSGLSPATGPRVLLASPWKIPIIENITIFTFTWSIIILLTFHRQSTEGMCNLCISSHLRIAIDFIGHNQIVCQPLRSSVTWPLLFYSHLWIIFITVLFRIIFIILYHVIFTLSFLLCLYLIFSIV